MGTAAMVFLIAAGATLCLVVGAPEMVARARRMVSRSSRSGTARSPFRALGLVLGCVGVVTLGTVVAGGPAYAWSGDTTIALTGVPACNAGTGMQVATVTADNSGGVNAMVTVSSGPIFLVGDTIPSPSKAEQLVEPGSYSGSVVLSISVDYPSQDTANFPVAPLTISFAGGCEQSTTTTQTTTTTGAATNVVVPVAFVPATVAPTTVAPTAVAPVAVVQPEVAPTTIPPAQVLGAQLAVTGSNAGPLAWTGLGLIALGLLAVTVGRRRIGSALRRR